MDKINLVGKVFVTFSFLFLLSLFMVTMYEVSTGYLPSDSEKKMQVIDKKYGNFGFNNNNDWLQNIFATPLKDDKNIPYTKLPDFEGKSDNITSYKQKEYKFVKCPSDKNDTYPNTYPEGTKCNVNALTEDEEFDFEEERQNLYENDGYEPEDHDYDIGNNNDNQEEEDNNNDEED